MNSHLILASPFLMPEPFIDPQEILHATIKFQAVSHYVGIPQFLHHLIDGDGPVTRTQGIKVIIRD